MSAPVAALPTPSPVAAGPAGRPRLLDVLRETATRQGYAAATIGSFVFWITRFIRFHGLRHPQELRLPDVGRFLEQVAREAREPLIAIEAARTALAFLYHEGLQLDVGELPRPRPARLLDQVRQVLRVRHYARTTEECYVQWIKRYIFFHGKRHPRELSAAEVEPFLTDLALRGHVSASTQNQALNALVFLYTQVLDIELGRLDAVRARRPKRLPLILSPEQVQAVLARIEGADGAFLLMAQLLYARPDQLRVRPRWPVRSPLVRQADGNSRPS